MSATVLPDDQLPSGRVSTIGERISYYTFIALHFLAFAAYWTGVPATAVWVGIFLYWLRMFGITGGYHRYFSHRSFKTSRGLQLCFAILGTASIQKGPLWWASTHRKHHKYSDTPSDVHSPIQRGFWYSHIGWILSQEHVETDMRLIKDFARYPELVWIGRYHFVPPLALALLCYLFCGGWAGVVVAFGWSTIAVWHCTFLINSATHLWGKRRFKTADHSRNSLILALLTMGEGWHNNHHHYMNSTNQGFYWWEVDFTLYILKALEKVGLVWELKRPPAHVLEKDRFDRPAVVAALKPTAPGHDVGRAGEVA